MIVRNFMFHDIRDLDFNFYPNRYKLKSFLTTDKFLKIIEFIESEYKIISSNQLNKLNELDRNKKYAVLTFDDGLADHYQTFKILKSKKLPATFFVPVLPVTENKVIQTHKIQFIIASVEDEKILTEEILETTGNRKETYEMYSKTKWKNNWWSKDMIFITNFLRNSIIPNKYEFTDYLFKKYVSDDECNFGSKFYLRESQIREISESKIMTLGGHGNTSENLLLVKDIENEINSTKRFLSNFTDDLIFSYPNGGYNQNIKESLIENGFTQAFTVNPFSITELDYEELNMMEIPRYDGAQKLL